MKKETADTRIFLPARLLSAQPITGTYHLEETEDERETSIIAKRSKKNLSKKIVLTTIALAAAITISSVVWVANKNNSEKNQSAISQNQDQSKKEAIQPVPTNEDQAKKTRKNWWQFITAQNSNYAYGILGGINNLSINFSNHSDYPLEEVTAKLTYLKSNGKPWKTKYISVFNMPPHSERKQSLPKVNRGKSVQVTVSKIVSKKMNFIYTPEKKRNGDDPYYAE